MKNTKRGELVAKLLTYPPPKKKAHSRRGVIKHKAELGDIAFPQKKKDLKLRWKVPSDRFFSGKPCNSGFLKFLWAGFLEEFWSFGWALSLSFSVDWIHIRLMKKYIYSLNPPSTTYGRFKVLITRQSLFLVLKLCNCGSSTSLCSSQKLEKSDRSHGGLKVRSDLFRPAGHRSLNWLYSLNDWVYSGLLTSGGSEPNDSVFQVDAPTDVILKTKVSPPFAALLTAKLNR